MPAASADLLSMPANAHAEDTQRELAARPRVTG